MKIIACFVLALGAIGQCFAQNDDLHRLALFTYGGAPVGDPDLKVLVNTAYAVGYDEDLKNPVWAVYRLGNLRSSTDFEKWERPSRFIVDPRTMARVKHDDFTRRWDGVTWDRGHMAPNSAMERQYGQQAQLETYFMTNVCPQTSSLNQGIWQGLEQQVRETISQDDTANNEVHDVWIIAGPIFDDTPVERWTSGIAIPTHFFKIVAYRKGYGGTVKAAAFIFPQKPAHSDLNRYARTVDEVEARTGLEFFPELTATKQRNLESKKRSLTLTDLP